MEFQAIRLLHPQASVLGTQLSDRYLSLQSKLKNRYINHPSIRKGIQRVKALIKSLKSCTPRPPLRCSESQFNFESQRTHRPKRRFNSQQSLIRNSQESVALRRLPRLRSTPRDESRGSIHSTGTPGRQLDSKGSGGHLKDASTHNLSHLQLGDSGEGHHRIHSASFSLLTEHKKVWLFGGLKGGKRKGIFHEESFQRKTFSENDKVMDGKAAVMSQRIDAQESVRPKLPLPRPLKVRNSHTSLPPQVNPTSPGVRFRKAVARTVAAMRSERLVGWEG